MDFDGPPEVSIGDGKNAVTARDDAVWQQKEAAAVAAAGATVELPNVQAPVDLPQVLVRGEVIRWCTTYYVSAVTSEVEGGSIFLTL